MPLGNSFGYPVATADELGLTDYFRKNPKLAGMAWGGGMNGSPKDQPRVLVANPFNPEIAKPEKMQGLLKIEAARHLMDETGYTPEFDLSKEQQEWRKTLGKYADDDLAAKQSVVSRIVANSAVPGVTPEQRAEAARFNALLDERENPDFIKAVMGNLQSPEQSPVLETVGWDDAVDPALIGAKQVVDHLKAKRSYVGKKPPKLNLKNIGAGTLAGILTESATQQGFNAARGGMPSENEYIANLERLGSRMVGGATGGAIMGAGLPGAIAGAATAAGVDALENIFGIGRALYELNEIQNDEIKRGLRKPAKSMLRK